MAIIKQQQQKQKITSVNEDVEKLEPLWECKMVQPLWKTAWRQFLKRLKIELPHDQQFDIWVYTQKNWMLGPKEESVQPTGGRNVSHLSIHWQINVWTKCCIYIKWNTMHLQNEGKDACYSMDEAWKILCYIKLASHKRANTVWFPCMRYLQLSNSWGRKYIGGYQG